MADFNTKPSNSTPELTRDIAQQILNLIVIHGDADKAYKQKDGSAYEPEHFKIVDKEIDRLFKEISILVSGKYVIQEEVYHYDEETGEKVIDTPKQYYTPTDKTDLKTMYESDYLDDTDILKLYVESKGYNYDTEFDTFLSDSTV